jgi:phosphate-selective porin
MRLCSKRCLKRGLFALICLAPWSVQAWAASPEAPSSGELEALRQEFHRELDAVRAENAYLRKRLDGYDQARAMEHKRIDDLQLEVDQSEGLTAGYDKNFYIKSADDLFRLNITGYVQFQGNFYENNNVPDRAQPVSNTGLAGVNRDDTFFLRRIRVRVGGNVVSKNLTWAVEPEYADNSLYLKDGWINYQWNDHAQLKMGQFKPPFSMESLESCTDLETIERATIVNLLRLNRRIGVQFYGDVLGGRLGYAVMIANNLGFGTTGQNTSDQNDEKAYIGRLVAKPFLKSDSKWIKGLEVSAAAATAVEGPPSSSAGLTVTDIVASVPNQRNPVQGTVPYIGGRQTQFDVGLSWVIDRWRLKGEYLHARVNRRDVPVTTMYPFGALPFHPITISGGYIQLSYVALDKPGWTIVPVIKYETLHVGGDNMTGTFVFGPAVGKQPAILGRYVSPVEFDNDVQAFTLGASWLINPKFKVMGDWVIESIGEDLIGATRLRRGENQDQNIIMVRTQLKF